MELNMRYLRNVTLFVKEYLYGPIPVSQAGQRYISGQDVPLRTFPCPRHQLTPTCSLVLDWAADTAAGVKSPTSLFIAYPCLKDRDKTENSLLQNPNDCQIVQKYLN